MEKAAFGWPFLYLRFEVRGSRFEVRGSRFEVRGSRFEVRGSRFEVRAECLKMRLTQEIKMNFSQKCDEK
ncbi:hypothetical protein C5F64_09145 [Photobacterium damselae subsp. damselae]|nr:hypothetical protein C5F64_09145 [Photobacterium damselae subsp. damselae]